MSPNQDKQFVGVVNPKYLYEHGLTFTLSRLNVHRWGAVQRKLALSELDIVSLYGPYDILCRHYSTATRGIDELLSLYGIDQSYYSNVTLFKSEIVNKIDGVDVPWELECDEPITTDVVELLDKIQQDWDAVKQDDRNRLIDRGIVLSKPADRGRLGGDSISAILLLRFPRVASRDDLVIYRSIITMYLERMTDNVQGLYWSNPANSVHCAIELRMPNLRDLSRFVMTDLQTLTPDIETATHIVIQHLTNKQVPLSKMVAQLPAVDQLLSPESFTLEKLLKSDEGDMLEFKSSFKWDWRQQKVNKELSRVLMKEMCAFLNGQGGALVLGVDDDKQIVGIDKDLATLRKKTTDGYRLSLADLVAEYLGAEVSENYQVTFENVDDKTVCLIHVRASSGPVYFNSTRSKKEFYIRQDASIRELDAPSTFRYISMHWPHYDL